MTRAGAYMHFMAGLPRNWLLIFSYISFSWLDGINAQLCQYDQGKAARLVCIDAAIRFSASGIRYIVRLRRLQRVDARHVIALRQRIITVVRLVETEGRLSESGASGGGCMVRDDRHKDTIIRIWEIYTNASDGCAKSKETGGTRSISPIATHLRCPSVSPTALAL